MSSNVTHDAVEAWKVRPLRPSDLPLDEACAAIGSKDPLFEAKHVNEFEWVLCKTGTNAPAIFSYAAFFASSDPMETGNLVIGDSKLAELIGEQRVQRWASYRCSYSYSFDTSIDTGLYSAQSAIDTYMAAVPGFIPPNEHRERRPWQSGAGSMQRFWMYAPMFLRVQPGQRKPPPPDHLHEWVKQADRRARMYRANPDRPNVLALEGKTLRRITDALPPELMAGDAVAISFTITYVVGVTDWYPSYNLIDVVRVASQPNDLPPDLPSGDIVTLAPPERSALTPGEFIQVPGLDEDTDMAIPTAKDNGPTAPGQSRDSTGQGAATAETHASSPQNSSAGDNADHLVQTTRVELQALQLSDHTAPDATATTAEVPNAPANDPGDSTLHSTGDLMEVDDGQGAQSSTEAFVVVPSLPQKRVSSDSSVSSVSSLDTGSIQWSDSAAEDNLNADFQDTDPASLSDGPNARVGRTLRGGRSQRRVRGRR